MFNPYKLTLPVTAGFFLCFTGLDPGNVPLLGIFASFGEVPMSEKLFEVRMLSQDIAEVVFSKQIYLDVSITDGIDTELETLAPGRKIYQLVDAKGPYIVNPEMRNAAAEGATGVRQIAIAWVSPDEKANREQEAILSKLPLPFKISFFSNRTDALVWLKSLGARE